jgi:hypothetical protein
MPEDKKKAIKNLIEKGGEFLEIDLDENGKDEYKITLPLSYDFIFSPADEKGKDLPISSIKTRDTSTIINVPGSAPRWKLKVIKPEDRSNMDGEGNSATPIDDEEGDRFVDWLNVKSKDMDEPTRKAVQNAKREIIIRKER